MLHDPTMEAYLKRPTPSVIVRTLSVRMIVLTSTRSAALALLIASLHAQSDERTHGGYSHPVDFGGVKHGILSHSMEATSMTWRWNATVRAAVPESGGAIDRPGSVIGFGDGRFLVSGTDSRTGKGWLVRLQLQIDPMAISEIESVDLGDGIDPLQLIWNSGEDRLYVLDFEGARILYAAYDGWGTLPRTWQVAVDGTSCPILAEHASAISLYPGHHTVSGKGVTLMDRALWGMTGSGPWVIHEDPQAGWLVNDISLQPVAELDVWAIRNSDTVRTHGPLEVHGAAGAFVIVESGSGSPVWEGALSASHQWETVTIPPGVLQPGVQYYASSGSGQQFRQSAPFVPLVR